MTPFVENGGNNVDIKIRNLDESAVARVDSLAKKKNMSRNEFLKGQVESLSILGELRALEDKYSALVSAMAEVVEHNTDELQKIRLLLERMK